MLSYLKDEAINGKEKSRGNIWEEKKNYRSSQPGTQFIYHLVFSTFPQKFLPRIHSMFLPYVSSTNTLFPLV